MIEIREPTPSELEDMYLLRWKINREPFGLPRGSEIDAEEANCFRVIAFDNTSKQVVGSARWAIHSQTAEISFMGVAEEHRSKGVGARILAFIHSAAKTQKVKNIKLYARKTAESFYKKQGYISKEEYVLGAPYYQKEVTMECSL